MENENYKFKKNSELRRDALSQLKGNWTVNILICVIYAIIATLLAEIPHSVGALTFFIEGPFILGISSCFLHLVRKEKYKIENLFDGFKRYLPAFLLYLLIYLFTLLWTLLLIVPGIIKGLSYSMSFYILSDNPEMGALEALEASKKMMDGYKAKLLGMELVFAGFVLLSVFTLFIGLIWLIPYMYASIANFYQNLKDKDMEYLESTSIETIEQTAASKQKL